MKSYSELFEERGSSYDIAMRRYPDARREEFEQIIAPAQLQPGMRVGDIPAGGGYMQGYLPDGVAWEGHEPCASFTNHGDVKDGAENRPLLPLPWAEGELDVAFSLAGVHHLEDKRELFTDIARVTKPGGTFILSDVAEGGAFAKFLDGFVGDYNSTGHEGAFLSEKTLSELEQAGWTVKSHHQSHFLWNFANRYEMGDFARHLFDICKTDVEHVASTIEKELGTVALADGGLGMNWSLMTICCTKN